MCVHYICSCIHVHTYIAKVVNYIFRTIHKKLMTSWKKEMILMYLDKVCNVFIRAQTNVETFECLFRQHCYQMFTNFTYWCLNFMQISHKSLFNAFLVQHLFMPQYNCLSMHVCTYICKHAVAYVCMCVHMYVTRWAKTGHI